MHGQIRENSGFTLVELMVVLIIIAVLIGVSIPIYFVFRERAREASTESDMKSMASAIEMYRNDYQVYPPQQGFPQNISSYFDGQAPEADFWNTAYSYVSSADSYQLTSSGKDKQAGTDDDIVFENGSMTASGAYDN